MQIIFIIVIFLCTEISGYKLVKKIKLNSQRNLINSFVDWSRHLVISRMWYPGWKKAIALDMKACFHCIKGDLSHAIIDLCLGCARGICACARACVYACILFANVNIQVFAFMCNCYGPPLRGNKMVHCIYNSFKHS